jgi:hypothetical protein
METDDFLNKVAEIEAAKRPALTATLQQHENSSPERLCPRCPLVQLAQRIKFASHKQVPTPNILEVRARPQPRPRPSAYPRHRPSAHAHCCKPTPKQVPTPNILEVRARPQPRPRPSAYPRHRPSAHAHCCKPTPKQVPTPNILEARARPQPRPLYIMPFYKCHLSQNALYVIILTHKSYNVMKYGF